MRKADRLDLTIDDNFIILDRNLGSGGEKIIINNDNNQNRVFVELIDAILNPGKHELYVHDTRTQNVYSSVAFAIEKKERIELT